MFDFKKIESIYHPYKINLKGNVAIFETSMGKYVLKKMNKDVFSLYGYLDKIGFNLIPNLDRNFDNKEYVQEYVDASFLPFSQYYEQMGEDLGCLHNKTVQDKIISFDDISNLKDNIENNINYLHNKYEGYFKSILLKEYYSPVEYLFIRNYSIILNNYNKCSELLESWYNNVKDDKKMRICLLHNNLSKEHYIVSKEKNYFISFDNFSFDLPVFDLVNTFKNIYQEDTYEIFFNGYSKEFNLEDNEYILFKILLLIPNDIEINNNFSDAQLLFFYLEKVNDFIKSYEKNKTSI